MCIISANIRPFQELFFYSQIPNPYQILKDEFLPYVTTKRLNLNTAKISIKNFWFEFGNSE